MIKECKTEGSKTPEFTVDRQGIKVKFFNMLPSEEPTVTSNDKLNENENKVYAAILTENNTKDDIITAAEMSERSIYRCISALKERNMIKRVGTNRTGHWEATRKL